MGISFSQCRFAYRRDHPVFVDLSLEFDSGVTVLLGPNGAGKSTLLSLAASAILPQAGMVRFRDLNTTVRRSRAAYRRQVGWLPQHVVAMPGMRVREQVAYSAWLKGVSRSDSWQRSLGALTQVDLRDLADRPVSSLSGGQLRRVGIAQALVHEARVILMDEPTAGLDPRQRKVFREVLGRLPEDVDIVVSTHQTEDLDQSYQHVVVLDHSRVRFQGTVAQFMSLVPVTGDASRRVEQAYLAFVEGEA